MGDDWWPGWAVDRKAEGVTGCFPFVRRAEMRLSPEECPRAAE